MNRATRADLARGGIEPVRPLQAPHPQELPSIFIDLLADLKPHDIPLYVQPTTKIRTTRLSPGREDTKDRFVGRQRSGACHRQSEIGLDLGHPTPSLLARDLPDFKNPS